MVRGRIHDLQRPVYVAAQVHHSADNLGLGDASHCRHRAVGRSPTADNRGHSLRQHGVVGSVLLRHLDHGVPTAHHARHHAFDTGKSIIEPYFTIPVPPIFDVMSALVLAFIGGIGMAYISLPRFHELAHEFKKLVESTISAVIIPLLPIYIFGIFLDMTRTGQAWHIMMTFAAIIGVIFAMHIALLLIQYCIAGIVARRDPIRMLATMLPAYFTALGTSSSAATIPVTLRQAIKMGVSEDIAGFSIPLCATIHMSGSCMKIIACSVALMLMQSMPFTTPMFIGFIFMLAIIMVASPGVPGGAIMAALGLLSSMLGFGEQDCALIIAIYIAMDSFGTACNVTGDGAIAIVINQLRRKKTQETAAEKAIS